MSVVQSLFDLCVAFLNALAALTGTTYEQINIIVFVILEPLVFFALLFLYLRKRRQYRKLKVLMQDKS